MRRQRIILHIDMDYFYAAVEERRNPELKGKPVVVGADPKEGKGRGVVSTCNYEARKYKIHSGMPISKAYKLCKECVFLPVDMDHYKEVSGSIMELLRKYAGRTQQASIDEIYLDISGKVKDFKEAENYARKIKSDIVKKEKLTCSIGIGPNKLIAKIASDIQKPGGLTAVPPSKVTGFLYPMSVRKIGGIGPKTEERLKEMGIETIKQLSKTKQDKLIEEFGSFGHEMHLRSKGIDNSEVEEKEGAKQIGRRRTFDNDTKDEKEIFGLLDSLCGMVHEELKNSGRFFKTVTVNARFEDFDTHTSSKSMQIASNKLDKIKEISHSLMEKYIKDRRKIRQIGVTVSNFAEKDAQKQLI